MKLKRLSIVLILVLFSNIVLHAQQLFPFGTLKSEIQKHHNLSDLRIDILNENIKKYYGIKTFNKINFYILDNLKKDKICDLEFFYFLGFYNDSLFAIISSTDELPANFELKNEKCINSKFFESDSIQSMTLVRKTSATTGGNIFGEAGTVIQNAYEDKYVIELISTGMSVFSPSHIQYAFITLSKKVIDKLNKNLKVHPDYKKHIKPSDIFTYSMYENFDNLQKPIKK